MNKLYTNVSLKATPIEPEHIVNKKYVDEAISRKIKDAVVAVSTSNIDATYDGTLTEMTLTQNAGSEAAFVFDGIEVAVGDRVLIAGQDDASQNGIYEVVTQGDDGTVSGSAVAGVLKRTEDFNGSEDIKLNVMIPVMRGDQNEDSTWVMVNDTLPDLDTDPIGFATFKSKDMASIFTATVKGDGVEKYIDISHGLGTEALTLRIVDHTTKEECEFNAIAQSNNVLRINADFVLTEDDEFDVTIIGG